MQEIKTARLILRPWQPSDLAPFAKLNADLRVMEYFPSILTRAESDQLANRICQALQVQGWGFWAVSVVGGADFIGFIGLAHVAFEADFVPAVEVGWRLAPAYWGKGYATEGAKSALQYGFETLQLDEIVAFTACKNTRSRNVMQKIGMQYTDDFDHPRLPPGHPLQQHALYSIKAGFSTEIWDMPPPHFQAQREVAACYIEVDGKMLLMQRALNCPEGKTWGVPAGKLEVGETPLQAALRELQEETGIEMLPPDLTPLGKLYVQKLRSSFIYHLFQAHLTKQPAVVLSAEHTHYKWASAAEIDDLPLVGGGKEAIKTYRQRKNSFL